MMSIQNQQKFKDQNLIDCLPQQLFVGNRQQFIRMFKENENFVTNSLGFFKGASDVPLYSSDVNYPEYQEAFFYYLFGVCEMDCYGVIDFQQDQVIIFIPRLDNFYKVWMPLLTTDDIRSKYPLIEEVKYIDELESYFQQRQPSTIYLNLGVNSDSKLTTLVPEDKFYKDVQSNINTNTMHDILCESRVIKTEEEIKIMKWASLITCEAHCNVMRNVRPGQRECQLESFFKYECEQKYFCGRVQPYLSICGCGPTASTLHYHDNNKWIIDGQMMLTDQGHQVHHYCSDVTTCFPVNGKFTQKQAQIYNIVLKSSRAVMQQAKAGVSWLEMHLLAEKTILQGLQELGLISGDLEEMIEKRLGFIFQPHGLGHLIGLDVHDVGGYLDGRTPQRQSLPGLKNLRTARVLKANMILTIEPGCYFREFLLKGQIEGLQIDLKYLNLDKISEYAAEVQGIRIEDVVLITENGCENLSNYLPRTVEQIEKHMRGEDWKC